MQTGERFGRYDILGPLGKRRYPFWHSKGRELDHVGLDGAMMAVAVTLTPDLQLGRVTKLFDGQAPPAVITGMVYDVSSRDGRFLMQKVVSSDTGGPNHVSVVFN